MLKDIRETIESLEAHIETEEKQIQLIKNDLKVLKEILLQQTKITNSKPLPESLNKLFEQFYIQDDTRGLGTRACNALLRAGKSIENLYNISFIELASMRNASGQVVAVIIAVLEHYGIKVETQYTSKIAKQVNELLPFYREKIIFK